MRAKFKTKQQLLNSGWTCDGDCYYHVNSTAHVTPSMLKRWEGEYFSFDDDDGYWNATIGGGQYTITPEMILNEAESVDDILKQYEDLSSSGE